jgi:hypothetical protein
MADLREELLGNLLSAARAVVAVAADYPCEEIEQLAAALEDIDEAAAADPPPARRECPLCRSERFERQEGKPDTCLCCGHQWRAG